MAISPLESPQGALTDRASLCALFQETASRVPERVALRTLADGSEITWGEYADKVREIAAGLAALGVEAGAIVAVMMTNRPEFHLVDTAVLHLGAAAVSPYNTLPADEVAWILNDAGVRVIATEAALLPTVLSARDAGAALDTIVVVDADAPGAMTLDELIGGGDPNFDFASRWQAVQQDALACLIYTSGTTGTPKGVELSHRAILGNLHGINSVLGQVDGARSVSFLPMAHIGERQFSHYRGMSGGFTVTCCDNIRELPAYLLAVRPHYLFSPPRLFEKLRAAIEAQLTASTDGDLGEALDVARDAVRASQKGELGDDLARRAERARETLKPFLAGLGLDEVVIGLTGSSPVRIELLEFWHALGLPLMQGWGMSETGAFGTLTRPGARDLGTCGKPIQGLELRLLDDGEIVVRSLYLMSGYRNKEEQTRETIDADGWLRSGDIGELDADGNLKVIDRKKELIINAFGKNMSPANIEAKIKDAHPVIGQACVIGDDRPYNVALVALDPEVAAALAKSLGLEAASVADIASDAQILAIVESAVAEANTRMSRVEQIKRYKVLAEEWLPGGDELTPTMKLKRRPIAQKYAPEIDALYSEPSPAA